MNKTEVFILSGFLGTGKTTLLKKMLSREREEGRKVAVLMNELGEISIDSDEVDEGIPLKELLGGCVCCTLQDKLEAQIQELLVLHKPDAIYIETTGAAHPVEVLDAVCSPLCSQSLKVKGILTTVDGTLWMGRGALPPQIQQLIVEQVKFSDLLIVNKTDLLTESEAGKLCMELQSLNHSAEIILTQFSKIPVKKYHELVLHDKSGADTAHVKSRLGLGTFVFTFKDRINKRSFEEFLMNLPEGIFRIKGYLHFDHCDFPDLFQYSYGTTLFMREYMKLPLNLVFIGFDIDWSCIKAKLERLES
ncbi:CobW family GTP-binding protein [Bacillus massilinigeriensis]|uniref:CobW family GTP-binding protein n=1 Tax=Bacillus mediterraneensis TaxID=1805474 RepID=UPI0008F7F1B6|nr:GTP-binding protein [Bacillus mediterraneensis]